MSKIGVLLINLGTPDEPTKPAVKRYLKEFLLDPRVIDYPFFLRQILVRCLIIPKRISETTSFYQRIWEKEGSPLMIHSKAQKELLQKELGEHYEVELAMRYQNPSIKDVLEKFKRVKELFVIPLFPQYASATTGSLHQEVMRCVKDWETIPKIHFHSSYPENELMVEAFAERARAKDLSKYDHFLFSFHGLPVRHILKANSHCMKGDCCDSLNSKNKLCYRAECFATARSIVKTLGLEKSQYSVCFQSRLGKEKWLEPYAIDHLKNLAQSGKKRVLVFCPSFVADCIETIHEIAVEYAKEFKVFGGELLDLVESLNDHPLWIQALSQMIKPDSIGLKNLCGLQKETRSFALSHQ